MNDILAPFAYSNGKPQAEAKLKAQPQHFVVKEDLGFSFTGAGEHLMLLIRKTGENTSFVANELAKACGVKSKDVSWAGLKDRHAVTEQWLSVHLPKGDTPDFYAFLTQYPSIEILDITRHNKKLRPGDLKGNFFEITLTQVTDIPSVISRLENVTRHGVPNYFGAQRFGRDGNNVEEARRWGRENVHTRNQNKRSLYLSSARSWIFNHILSKRIESGVWQSPLIGDILLNAEGTLKVTETNFADSEQLVSNGKAEITAAMAGDNALPTSDTALNIEQPCLDAEPDLMALIRGNRMRHERRVVQLFPKKLAWDVQDNEIALKFWLPSGCFATSIMRELVNAEEEERQFSPS
ncbi:tRNA pseudouridine(13) synthase TruD [Vibrio penaeicida]|uniref:tRNA pseudouridine synthase D n=1 Tax=Vibrio penaeicida TaxID=104609 RepID=A0AAV5NU27_9VIBR|nr:tRNA pseudouridine(13) synthase TruD [Vibrio penaeicida]RTZ24550.1 tRNA pseudouridine(13) synthase TruD [Vibrio penaeicida]GLQ73789.1 tRNA pseudouridine synthase D [Vibrio penaeicida]